ncbi:hypothetical protein [uncultured Aquimarina sp.]|nr:hypothetical protein [uncultured Aquimarina sp.]
MFLQKGNGTLIIRADVFPELVEWAGGECNVFNGSDYKSIN